MTDDFTAQIDRKVAEVNFSGVISVNLHGESYQRAFGFRDRANQIRNTMDTRFGIASGTKGFTAVGIGQLIEAGALGFDTTAKSILGDRISNLHPDITIAHLLGHTSGIGDYLDEDEISDWNAFVLPIPVQNLNSPLDYIPLFEAKTQKFTPGERFSYSNGGYILLSMIIEIVGAKPYQEFIKEKVFSTAGMQRSGFFRSDSLPENTAIGYLSTDSSRSNIFHLPVRGGGDGGAYTTIADMERFWSALKGAQLMGQEIVTTFLTPKESIGNNRSYGYGFYLNEITKEPMLVGHDVGVSFHSRIGLTNNEGFTIISNSFTDGTTGAQPLVGLIRELFEQRL